MALKTDFVDALFEQKKIRLNENEDGTVTPVDETEYTVRGTSLGLSTSTPPTRPSTALTVPRSALPLPPLDGLANLPRIYRLFKRRGLWQRILRC